MEIEVYIVIKLLIYAKEEILREVRKSAVATAFDENTTSGNMLLNQNISVAREWVIFLVL